MFPTEGLTLVHNILPFGAGKTELGLREEVGDGPNGSG